MIKKKEFALTQLVDFSVTSEIHEFKFSIKWWFELNIIQTKFRLDRITNIIKKSKLKIKLK